MPRTRAQVASRTAYPAIAGLISGFVIWIVGKPGLGLEGSGFGAAFIAGIIIAVVGALFRWLITLLVGAPTDMGGFLSAIVHVIDAAIVLWISSRTYPGLKIKGFGGALVAAIAIGVVAWLIGLVLRTVGLA